MMEPYNNKKLINLAPIRDKVIDSFVNNRLHHSTIINGARGMGKATLCYHMANKILDHDSPKKPVSAGVDLFGGLGPTIDNNVLDDNNETFNLIKNKRHPDLLVIEKEEDDKEIKIASARKLLDFISLAPFLSKNKVVIIDSVSEMNISAQNAILKIVEEPVKNTYIFLICHNSSNVLDTIKSRCNKIDVANYSMEEWKSVFSHVYKQKFDEEYMEWLYGVTNGSMFLTKAMIELDGRSLYTSIENMFSLNELDITFLHSLADKLNDNDNLFELFQTLIMLFLYKTLRYFSSDNADNKFKTRNANFILKNTEKSILDKLSFANETFSDVTRYNLNKKHAVLLLCDNIMEGA